MRAFLTGGTGYIGAAVASALKEGGHQVLSLVRNEAGAEAARDAGYVPVLGDLREPDRFLGQIRTAGAVIHMANTGDSDAAEIDESVTRVLASTVRRSGKPFLYTSGVWVLGDSKGKRLDENPPLDPIPLVAWRAPSVAPIVSLGKARSTLRPFADALDLDQDVSSYRTRKRLGWNPSSLRPSEMEIRGGEAS